MPGEPPYPHPHWGQPLALTFSKAKQLPRADTEATHLSQDKKKNKLEAQGKKKQQMGHQKQESKADRKPGIVIFSFRSA